MYPEAKMLLPMDVWKLPKSKENMLSEICQSGDYFAQIKKDGHWYKIEKTENYNYLFSGNISKVTGFLSEKSDRVPHIIKALSFLPKNTTLIGEIYYPGTTSKEVTTIMGCLPEKAIERQSEKGLIHYYIHDIIEYNGKDLTKIGALNRYLILKDIFKDFNFVKYKFIEVADIATENLEDFINTCFAAGEEGVVLKKKDAGYAAGARPAWDTIKIKKVDTLDAICIGFCEPTKEYAGKESANWPYQIDGQLVTKAFFYGWKGAFEIGAYDKDGKIVKIGTISSGLTDELKEDFSKNPEKYLNKVVELQCMEKDVEEKSLRHGFLIRFREDKNAEKCLLEDIFK